MTKTNWILIAVLAVVLFLFYQSACTSERETVKIPVPEKTGAFEAVKPTTTPIVSRVIEWRNNPTTAGIRVVQNDTLNARLLSENEILRQQFKTASDSLKLAKYDKSIALSDFSGTFEDSVVKIDMSGKVRGEVQSIGISKHTIKESTVIVSKPSKKPFGVGVIVGYGIDLKPMVGVGASYNIIRF